LSPDPSSQPGYGARKEAYAATHFPGRYGQTRGELYNVNATSMLLERNANLVF
jgi:hypothetical protein